MVDDALWYKDAIIYELHVRAFYDHDGDGIGDFRGLRARLDYLQDLGVTAVWLLPFYPSPLKDDGYDIADYTAVNPAYGQLADVRNFVREAHRRGLRVITELVFNHTSDQHPWFQRARRAPRGSVARNFYVWSDTTERYPEARIIFKDFETSNWTWDREAGAYFWHRFYSHQPDLNFDNPAVHRALMRALDFWLGLGVDGMRLDAIPYLYEREGTVCENLPETHAFLKRLRAHIDGRFVSRMLLAEANQWPEDTAAYFGDGDECHMAFHFPLMPRMFMAIQLEDRFPILDILAQTPSIPESAQWALFLRNHDELTLEMVTDEERDYMYRVYASDPRARINLGIRRRLAPLLGNDRRAIELMNGLLFSLPGTPVIYYGDEIGMGDNIYLGDRDGVRTPMQWSADRNAGFSRASPQRLYLPVITEPEYHYETVNVETQQGNRHSLLWWMKRLIALRKRYRAFGRGSLTFLQPDNRKVLAYLRSYEDEQILVVANLSRRVQPVELDLSPFGGRTPVEMFSRGALPPIGEQPYFLTLAPHSFLWLSLEPQRAPALSPSADAAPGIPVAVLAGPTDGLLHEMSRLTRLEGILGSYIRAQPWYEGQGRRQTVVRLAELAPLGHQTGSLALALVEIEYADGDPTSYVLPLALAAGAAADRVREQAPGAAIALLRLEGGSEWLLYDATAAPSLGQALLALIVGRGRVVGHAGELAGSPAPGLRELLAEAPLPDPIASDAPVATRLRFGDRLALRLYRRLQPGTSADLEIGRALLGRDGFAHAAPLAGAVEYRRRGEVATLAVLRAALPGEGDAWDYTVDVLGGYYERALAEPELPPTTPPFAAGPLLAAADVPPELVTRLAEGYLEHARQLGERTAELHHALARLSGPALEPEPFNAFSQRSLYQSLRSRVGQALDRLRRELAAIPAEVRAEAEELLGLEQGIYTHYRPLLQRRIGGLRTRIHGNYQLRELRYTGRDFMVLDFEGDEQRPMSERRLKRSPLRDIARMLRSFDEAAEVALRRQAAGASVRPVDVGQGEGWARLWRFWVGATFLGAYLAHAGAAPFLPADRADLALLLDALLLDATVDDLARALERRPERVAPPLRAVLEQVRR